MMEISSDLPRNFWQPSVVFGNFRSFSEMCGNVRVDLGQTFENLRKIVKSVVISMLVCLIII